MQNPYHPPSVGGFGGPASSGTISQQTANIMARTKGWVRFIGVMLIISGLLMLIPAVFAFSTGEPAQIGAGLVFLFSALITGVIPGGKLNAYANRIAGLLRTGLASDLESALNEHRGFWKYLGILQIIGLSFFVLAIVISAAA